MINHTPREMNNYTWKGNMIKLQWCNSNKDRRYICQKDLFKNFLELSLNVGFASHGLLQNSPILILLFRCPFHGLILDVQDPVHRNFEGGKSWDITGFLHRYIHFVQKIYSPIMIAPCQCRPPELYYEHMFLLKFKLARCH